LLTGVECQVTTRVDFAASTLLMMIIIIVLGFIAGGYAFPLQEAFAANIVISDVVRLLLWLLFFIPIIVSKIEFDMVMECELD